ncbi:MAG: hypothetical protein LCH39_09105 [Proteobacteria bacterium]|nr:hypothetical protein [Pseudomonadota bacterium]
MASALIAKSTAVISAHRSALRLAALAVPLALSLAACGTTKLGEGEVSEGERRFTEKLLFPTQKLPEAKPFNEREIGCPAVSLLDGTATWRVGADSARGVSYQASINDLARECTQEGTTMRIKVGVRGRVVIGDGGRGGTINVPVRVAVKDGDKTLHSRVSTASVSVADSGSSAFTVLDEGIIVTITDKDPADQYSIIVGIDPQGARSGAPRKRRR